MLRDDTHFVTDEEYAEIQRKYGGGYVVRRGAEVLVSATSFDDLIDRADAMNIDWADVIVTYVDRADVVRIYGFSA